ncbi:alpha/beta hydrolase [Protaetiibacter intestinalis]|uniref:Alpha/beta hydrolase n=1 Tax=Protaetiibacter intestinalis TaxID=2419774 RepID=A0A387BCD3_9MICO|nr:alpha/beta hydrolase [Protaetiibacter intestinalis]
MLAGCGIWDDLEEHERQEDAARPFYEVPDPLPAGEPGELIRSLPIETAPAGSRAWRVLYHSTGTTGDDIAVSGTVVVPDGEPPAGGWPVIAWAHPTTGAVAECAPSSGFAPLDLIEGMDDLLDDGFAITATDYPGLGAAGPSSYLLGDVEGHAVLDSVRAGRALEGVELSTDVFFWGHSQGGQAALFAAQDAAGYAPELRPVAAAVAAPAAELATLLADDIDDVSGVTIGAYAFTAYQAAYEPTHPGLALTDILTPDAAAAAVKMEQLCLFGQNSELHAIATPLIGGFLAADPSTTQPWSDFLVENTPGAAPFGVPVLVVQGESDELVRPSATADFVTRMCAAGQRLAYVGYPTATHATIVIQALPDVRAWFLAAREGSTSRALCAA